MPTTYGWVFGEHTLIVAHSSREWYGERVTTAWTWAPLPCSAAIEYGKATLAQPAITAASTAIDFQVGIRTWRKITLQ
jgi:hypothetical protein